jgi:iron transport multicopper oxidase
VVSQYCDGLRGPLVVYDHDDPHAKLYDVDDGQSCYSAQFSRCLCSQNRLHSYYSCRLVKTHNQGCEGANRHPFRYHLPFAVVPKPPISNSTLINGRGRYPGGPRSPLSVVNVIHGKRYRFRLVSMSCDSYFDFSIDGHKMTIIEADGISTQPLIVDSIRIHAGQRYSFVLDAEKKDGNFWIRAEQHSGLDGGPTGFAGGINSAILRYDGSYEVDPTTSQTRSIIPLVETNLHPLENPGAPGRPHVGGADISLNLALGLTPTSFLVNNATFQPPSIPVLLQILSGARKASELLPAGNVFTLPPNKVVELSIPAHNAPGGPVSTLPSLPLTALTRTFTASFPPPWGESLPLYLDANLS